MRDGRPLRFLCAAIGGWTAFRVFALWPVAEKAALHALGRIVVPAVAAVGMPFATPPATSVRPPDSPSVARVAVGLKDADVVPVIAMGRSDASSISMARAAPPAPQGAIGAPLRPTPIAHGPGRLAGSAWMLARGGPSGTLSGGQLGASQAGVRLTYAIDSARRLALAVRIATPLSGRGKEAAVGLDWKPTRLPFHLIAEQRFVLDGGKGGPTLGIIGGYGPGMVAPGVRLEAYGQAGAIARRGIEGFVDTAMRVTHPVVVRGPVRIDVGAGAWGSAQRGAARFDLGPTLGIVVPVRKHGVRLALDWRERIAGEARPGSGPAFTIGSDF